VAADSLCAALAQCVMCCRCCAVLCCAVLSCAAPQYGSAKSVANIAGMVAANVLRGDHPMVHWDTIDWDALRADPQALIVDVREVSRSNVL